MVLRYSVVIQMVTRVMGFSVHSAEQIEAGHSVEIIATLGMHHV